MPTPVNITVAGGKSYRKNTRDERLKLSANETHQTDTVAKDSIGGKRMQHVDYPLEAPHRLSAIASKSTEVLRLIRKSISDGSDGVACFEFLGKWMLGEACPCLPLKLLESSVEKRLNNGLPWRATHVPDWRNAGGKRRIVLLRTERLGRREWWDRRSDVGWHERQPSISGFPELCSLCSTHSA
jgi:hypothetical protein